MLSKCRNVYFDKHRIGVGTGIAGTWVKRFSKGQRCAGKKKFPVQYAGTEIVFMFMNIDTTSGLRYNLVRNKHMYSGQNREGTDAYVSEVVGRYDRRWVVIGMIDSTVAEVGFDGLSSHTYRDAIIKVSNVEIVK